MGRLKMVDVRNPLSFPLDMAMDQRLLRKTHKKNADVYSNDRLSTIQF